MMKRRDFLKCTPSRYALLTGHYLFRIDSWLPVFLRTPLMIPEDQLTIGSLMKEAGYATACIGKWHLGFGKVSPTDWNKPLEPGPLELGFDYYIGVPVVNSHPPFMYVENHHVVGLAKDDPFAHAVSKAHQDRGRKPDRWQSIRLYGTPVGRGQGYPKAMWISPSKSGISHTYNVMNR